MEWAHEEETYLKEVMKSCDDHAKLFHKVHKKYREFQTRLKIPLIIVGSFSGVASFGTASFPEQWQQFVSLIVGVVSIVIAILNTIESYYKVVETTGESLNTASALERLRDDINKELSIPPASRETRGITYLRDCYVRYQQIVSQSPSGIKWRKLAHNHNKKNREGGEEIIQREGSPGSVSETSEESIKII